MDEVYIDLLKILVILVLLGTVWFWVDRLRSVIGLGIISAILTYFIYEGYTKYNYDHLIIRKINSANYKIRQLEKGDRMPEVYCMENDKMIQDVLLNKNYIEELLENMEREDSPCIFGFSIKPKGDGNNIPMPNLIILNNRYHFQNKFSVTKRTEDYRFIFNPIQIGGSVKSEVFITKHDSLCEFSSEDRYFSKLFVQYNCKIPVFVNNKMYIKPANLMETGELAYCLQDYWKYINNTTKVCQ